MKKYRFYGGLFVTLFPITTSCGYLTNNVKNTTNYSLPLEQAKYAQAQLLAIHTTLNEKYKTKISSLFGLLCFWTLARFYLAETRRRISRWHLEGLALLKIIKTNALRLWNNHHSDRKTSQVEI